MSKKALIPVIPALTALAFAAAPALADAPEAVSANWAGYEISPNNSSGFSNVSGSWVQPSANCSSTNGTATYSAFWVGLGGGSQGSQALEQTGTQADCTASGSANYFAWYELVPNAPVELSLPIHAGDHVSAQVRVEGNSVTIYLIDHTTGGTFDKTLQFNNPDTSTAEWVAEAPSQCQGGPSAGDCTPLPLADFGTVNFTGAAATSDGQTGGIENSNWTAEPLALDSSAADSSGGYSDPTSYTTGGSDAAAAPSNLSGTGAFSVTYSANGLSSGSGSSSASDTSGYSGGSGYGDSSGYGNGYGDSSGYGNGYGDSSGYGDPGGYGDGSGYGGGYGDSSASGYGSGSGYSVTLPGFGIVLNF